MEGALRRGLLGYYGRHRHIGQLQRLVGQQGGAHDLERRVFRAADGNRAIQALPAANANRLQPRGFERNGGDEGVVLLPLSLRQSIIPLP